MNEPKAEFKNAHAKLAEVQYKVIVPKDRKNDFAKYSFRNAEDILASLREPLHEVGAVLLLRDKIVFLNEEKYMTCTAQFVNIDDPKDVISIKGIARMGDTKGGMSPEQVTGSSSSYARKYALSALFKIGGEEDDDSLNQGGNYNGSKQSAPKAPAKPFGKPVSDLPKSPRKQSAVLDDPEGAGEVAYKEEQKKVLDGKKKLIKQMMPDVKTKEQFESAFELILDKPTVDTIEDADKVIKALAQGEEALNA